MRTVPGPQVGTGTVRTSHRPIKRLKIGARFSASPPVHCSSVPAFFFLSFEAFLALFFLFCLPTGALELLVVASLAVTLPRAFITSSIEGNPQIMGVLAVAGPCARMWLANLRCVFHAGLASDAVGDVGVPKKAPAATTGATNALLASGDMFLIMSAISFIALIWAGCTFSFSSVQRIVGL